MSFCLASTHRILRQVPIWSRTFTSNPNKFFILNALGIDRPGIVSDVTKIVTDVGGNVGESRAVKLGNHFSMMMLVTVPESNATKFGVSLENDLKDLTTTFIETANPDLVKTTPRIVFTGDLTLSGADHPGIVHEVTSLIARSGLSLDDLKTSQEEAPFGGTTLFRMEGMVTMSEPVASKFDLESLQDDLINLGNSLNCDISLEEASEEDISASSA